MSKQYPDEFKRDVADYARRSGASKEEVAETFGVSVTSVKRWVKQAETDDGVRDGLTSVEQAELVEVKRRNRQLEQEVEILRRATAYFAKDVAPK